MDGAGGQTAPTERRLSRRRPLIRPCANALHPERGHFPNDQAALKMLYLVATTKRVNRSNMTGQINGWKQIINTLIVHYGERISATR